MAKYKETPCEYYVCFNECEKGRKAEHSGYCQKCSLYKPRCREDHVNRKREKLDRINKKELRCRDVY